MFVLSKIHCESLIFIKICDIYFVLHCHAVASAMSLAAVFSYFSQNARST